MAAIDKLLEKMAHRRVDEVVLAGAEPMMLYSGGSQASGATITAERLHELVLEITPEAYQSRLDQDCIFAFPYATQFGKFLISVSRQAERLCVTVSKDGAPSNSAPAPSNDGTSAAPNANEGLSYIAAPPRGAGKSTLLYSRDTRGGAIGALTFSPDGKTIVTGVGDGSVRMWQATSGTNLKILKPSGGLPIDVSRATKNDGILALDTGLNGTSLACGGTAGQLDIWNLRSGKLERSLHPCSANRVTGVAFSPDGSTIAVSTALASSALTRSLAMTAATIMNPVAVAGAKAVAGSLQLIEAKTGRTLLEDDLMCGISSVDFSPTGDFFVGGTHDGTVKLCNIKCTLVGAARTLTRNLLTGAQKTEYLGELDCTTCVNSVFISPDATKLMVGTTTDVQLWNLETGLRIWQTLLGGPTQTVAISPDGSLIVAAGDDGEVRFFGSHNGEIERSLVEPLTAINTLSFSNDGTTLAAGCQDGTLYVWKLN